MKGGRGRNKAAMAPQQDSDDSFGVDAFGDDFGIGVIIPSSGSPHEWEEDPNADIGDDFGGRGGHRKHKKKQPPPPADDGGGDDGGGDDAFGKDVHNPHGISSRGWTPNVNTDPNASSSFGDEYDADGS